MEYNDLLNELLDLLDENPDIKKIRKLKIKLLNNQELQDNLAIYHERKTVDSKKKLLENLDYKEYLILENNIRLLILDIKNKFNTFKIGGCLDESH